MTNASDEFDLEMEEDKEKDEGEEPYELQNKNNEHAVIDGEEQQLSVNDAMVIETLPASSEPLIS